MQAETLSEIQKRGRFFSESFPGTKASDEWQRHREQLQETESTVSRQRRTLHSLSTWQRTVAEDAAQMQHQDA